MKIKIIVGALALMLFSSIGFAQDETKGQVRLFQNFFEDAYITPELYLEAQVNYRYFDDWGLLAPGFDSYDRYGFKVRAGLPVGPKTEVHGSLGLIHVDPGADNGSETSVTDLYLGARHLLVDEATKVSVGGFVTLPTGQEDAWEDNTDFGVYGAARHPLEWGVVATGTVGLYYLESPPSFNRDHKTVLRLSGGAIYEWYDNLHVIGEVVSESRHDYLLFSGGFDYTLDPRTHVRGNVGFGVDDGAPDIEVTLSYLFLF